MSKRKSSDVASQSASSAAPPPHKSLYHLPSAAAIRDSIESLVIAFILAFLFRTFEAEAFVIPTGSMAPTLMGRHKDLACPKCGFPYQVSASEEVNRETEAPLGPEDVVTRSTCPMCRYTANLGRGNPQHETYLSYPGDRVLVGKFCYAWKDPDRWDVVVFHYPGGASLNYIKRLIGLPGETIRIQHGDIWVRGNDKPDDAFQIARKPPNKLLAVLQPVFDNDYMPKIAKYGWPSRWQPESPADGGAGVWHSDDLATFHTDGTARGETWLYYHHLEPSTDQWMAAGKSSSDQTLEVSPQCITNFTAYDTYVLRKNATPEPTLDLARVGQDWVGDLALECAVFTESDAGELVFELRKGGRQFQCRIDVATGKATLGISGDDMAAFHPTAPTNLRGKGCHTVRFSNCDEELLLWVDNVVVDFDAPTTYADLNNTHPDRSDLSPVGVASVGVRAQISHLRILRDLYYIAAKYTAANERSQSNDYEDPLSSSQNLSKQLIHNRPRKRSVEFRLEPDQFFMLGDNSTCSLDGRLWNPEHYVRRELLIGKALVVYWPHSWDSIRTPWGNVPFPYFPNFQRMGLVR